MHNARVALLDKQLRSSQQPLPPMPQHHPLGVAQERTQPPSPSQPAAAVPSEHTRALVQGTTQHEHTQQHTQRSHRPRCRRAAPPRCCAYTADGRLAALLPQGLHECEPQCGRHALCARNKQVGSKIGAQKQMWSMGVDRRAPGTQKLVGSKIGVQK
eukprot:scaffold50833_cov20-Tisochrysis_lutea.AAC.6